MKRCFILAATVLSALGATAQVTPAGGAAVPSDTPSYKVGVTIFADYTWVDSPTTTDADGNVIHPSAFNLVRSYLNVTGNLNHRIAFRITPDITRESGSGSTLSGSYTFRLKYAYAQFNLDDWTTPGSWVRAGVHQTPYLDFTEGIYRYRWQGTLFPEREGFISSSDAGLSAQWVIPNNHGSIHGGFYNGEGYSRSETNDQKAFQLRTTYRPFPNGTVWTKGLQFHAFAVGDHYIEDGKRNRLMLTATWQHPRVNAGFDTLFTKDQTSTRAAEVEGKGWSFWATPKLPHNFEILLRHDYYEPNVDTSQERIRNIIGVAYWIPNLDKVLAAVMLDRDSLEQRGFATPRPDDTRYALKLYINF
ncbi:MAG TPA: porin [Thermoanaerobaculia bacterium]|nr:porin [Thermoanaerobaculia bacterium]